MFFFLGYEMGRGFILSVLVSFDFEVVETELKRGRGRRDDKKKFGICNLQLVCLSHVDLAIVLSPCLLQGKWVGRRWGGLLCRGRGVRTEEMSPGKHCENVTATLTAGQFSKSDAASHFPLCVRTKSWGGSGWSRD